MALLPILEYPDPRLRKVASPVAAVTPDIQKLVRDMAETMYAAPGIGLAATQVDVHKRVIVMDLSETRDELKVFINPEIIEADGEAENEEGCLSVPGYFDRVVRPATRPGAGARTSAASRSSSKPRTFSPCASSTRWIISLGKVFVDRLSPLKRARLAARLRKKQRLAG